MYQALSGSQASSEAGFDEVKTYFPSVWFDI